MSTWEARPQVALRLHFTQPDRSRIYIRDWQRVESRNIYYVEDEFWSNTWRYRNRLEFYFPLNNPHMFVDKTWYLLADAELFVNLDSAPEERFNDNWRLRGGLGYRVSFSWQVEAIYTRQLARDTLAESFDFSNNIFRFRFKYHW